MSTALCACGCGTPTNVVNGVPRTWVRGHSRRRVGPPKPGRYVNVWTGAEYRLEHLLVAERALGRALPAGAVVHHVNGEPSDNRPQNLVICEDQAYHLLLHRRTRSLAAAGRPDLRRCRYCGEHDSLDHMYVRRKAGVVTHCWHRACASEYVRQWRAAS